MTRCIVASSESGEREEVYFTEDMDSPADDFFFMDEMTIDSDTVLNVDFPSSFPLETILRRQ